jgi:hypothetical protein
MAPTSMSTVCIQGLGCRYAERHHQASIHVDGSADEAQHALHAQHAVEHVQARVQHGPYTYLLE